jgi:hypothetical protein
VTEPTVDAEVLLTGRQLAERAGISYRQADYWERTGLIGAVVPATGSGSRRLFDETGLRQARAVAMYIDLLDDRGRVTHRRRQVAAAALGEGRFLVVNESGAFATNSPSDVVRPILDGRGPVVVLDLGAGS